MRVRHINVLFAWLWDWNDGTENAKPERLHWDQKPYRMLFQQCFTQIKTIYGKDRAWIWHDMVKGLFVRSHWMLPYPSRKTFFSQNKHGQLQWWCSVHDGFLHYLSSKRKHLQDQSHWILEPWEIRLLPIDGWDKGESPMNVDINLAPVPQNLDAFTCEDPDHQIESVRICDSGGKELPITSTPDSMIYSSGPHHIRCYHLRSYLQRHEKNPMFHTNPKWFLTYLDDVLHDVIESRERELHALNPAQASRPWQSRRRPEVPPPDESRSVDGEAGCDDGDNGSSDQRCKIHIELQALRKTRQAVQAYVFAYKTQQQSMNHLQTELRRHRRPGWTRAQRERCQQRLQNAGKQLQVYQAQLVHLSHHVNQQIQFQSM